MDKKTDFRNRVFALCFFFFLFSSRYLRGIREVMGWAGLGWEGMEWNGFRHTHTHTYSSHRNWAL